MMSIAIPLIATILLIALFLVLTFTGFGVLLLPLLLPLGIITLILWGLFVTSAAIEGFLKSWQGIVTLILILGGVIGVIYYKIKK